MIQLGLRYKVLTKPSKLVRVGWLEVIIVIVDGQYKQTKDLEFLVVLCKAGADLGRCFLDMKCHATFHPTEVSTLGVNPLVVK